MIYYFQPHFSAIHHLDLRDESGEIIGQSVAEASNSKKQMDEPSSSKENNGFNTSMLGRFL